MTSERPCWNEPGVINWTASDELINYVQIFVELDEFVGGEWKETARWIKFEEDVEESEMWGKPRVASLSFHSLLELRRTIEKGD